jgi:hypothetical protein
VIVVGFGEFGDDHVRFAFFVFDQRKAHVIVSVSPGVGFGEFGDDHVRFALIENEERTRQAVRGIKEMFRKDGMIC